MRYQKEPSDAQIEALLQALRVAMKNKNQFFVMADLKPHALSAGSSKIDLIEFMVRCMAANEEVSEFLINVVMNYMANKILNDLCGQCEKIDSCHKKANHPDQRQLLIPRNAWSVLSPHPDIAKPLRLGYFV